MDTFSPEYIRSYSDEFKSLPSEYYDSGCRDWRDELTHQPKILENWPTHHDDPKGYSDDAKHFLIHVCSSRGIDKTPPNRRNKMYYAVKYANIFARAARLAERDPLAMPDKEYHRLYDLQRRYEELQAKLDGVKPCEFYRCNLCITPSAVGPSGRVHWERCKTWDDKPAASLTWEFWPDQRTV